MNLQDATALVTGGGRRLGREITLALARAGANVAICYRESASDAEETVHAARALGVQALAERADASDLDQVDRLVEITLSQFSRIDILIANAGAFRRMPMSTLTEADWHEMLDNNLGTFRLPATRIGRHMKSQGRGCIVALADVAGIRPWTDYAPYSVAKSGVIALTKALALELAPEVRVNAIAPGPILVSPEDRDPAFEREIARTPLRRPGHPADICDAVLFLARAEYITGVVLPVDGGRLLS